MELLATTILKQPPAVIKLSTSWLYLHLLAILPSATLATETLVDVCLLLSFFLLRTRSLAQQTHQSVRSGCGTLWYLVFLVFLLFFQLPFYCQRQGQWLTSTTVVDITPHMPARTRPVNIIAWTWVDKHKKSKRHARTQKTMAAGSFQYWQWILHPPNQFIFGLPPLQTKQGAGGFLKAIVDLCVTQLSEFELENRTLVADSV